MDFTQTATSMVVSVGVILDKTEVLVDGINGATVQASAFNTNLEDITADEVVWSVSPTTGVSIGSKAGEIVVDANAAPGRYCVTAAKDIAFNGENTATAYFTVTRAPSVAQSMEISCNTSALTVPTAGEVQKTIPFTATVKDQYGETISAPVTWSLVETYPGITMDSETGKLTITSKASACTLQVKAIYGALEKTSEFAVTKAPSSATSTFIMKDGERIVSDVVPIPTGDTPNSVRYTCEIWDQFDQVMDGAGEHITWSIADLNSDPTTITGVSVANGKLTITKEATADTCFMLKAKYNEQTSSTKPEDAVTITLKKIEITWPMPVYKDNPTYGDTWSEIVTGFNGGSASLNGSNVPGEFTLVSTGCPNAGNQSYTIQFASTDGKYTLTKTETVNIAKRTVTLTWSGNTNLVYDGSPKTVTATVGNVLEGDDCTVTVTGGSETNAGTHTATALLSDTVSGNYQLPTTYTCQYTIEKAAVSQPDLQTGLAYNRQLQTVAEVAEDGLYTLTGNTATDAGTYTGTASLKDKANYKWAIKDNSDDLSFSWTIDRAPYTVSLTMKTVSVKVGTSDTDFLPTATTVGVNSETPAGTLKFYTDASRTTDVTGEWVSKQLVGDHTLYWSFTTTNSNYVEAAKTGTITMTVIEGDPQNVTFNPTSKTVTYGDAAFTNTVTVTTTGGTSVSGASVTYASSNPQVVTVDEDTGEVTIVGAGTATITATAAAVPGQYAQGTGSYTVTVNPKALTDDMVADVSGTHSYTGSAIHPEPTVTDGTKTLVEGTDFTYSYGANTDVGAATVTVTGKGNYQGTITKNFAITKADYLGSASYNVNVLTKQEIPASGTISVNAFFQNVPADAKITNVAAKPATNHIMYSVSASGGTITYQSNTKLTTAKLVDTYDVTISTRNYNNITATLTFTTVDKTPVIVSGVAVAGKTYDGKTVSYTGTPVAKKADGSTVAVTGFTYTWMKDSVALNGAPKDAGSYKLRVAVAETDPAYTGYVDLSFTISKATITITAQNASVTVNSSMPKLSYQVTGLAAGEKLATEPTLTCNAKLNQIGSYPIVPSGAAVPNTDNYNETIVYKNGTLSVVSNEKPQVTVTGGAHGFATISDPDAKEGDVVAITVTCDPGYEVDEVTVTTLSGKSVRVVKTGGKYTFVMPAEKVKIQVTYQEIQEVAYTDVVVGSWYEEAVAYVSDNGIMNGVGGGKFAPNRAVTRAMVWTVLARMDGEDTASTSLWYAKAQQWAMETGVSDGTNPESAITREQLATMLYRYYGSPAVSGSLSGYVDSASVSDWAKDAMVWAVQEGLIQGTGANKLSPTAATTRAQLAQILMLLDLKF